MLAATAAALSVSARMTGGWDFRIVNSARDGRELVRMLEPLVWGVEGPEGPTFIVVPRMFETDFASIPRIVRGRYPAMGPWARAALPHDFGYMTRGTQDAALCFCTNRAGERVPMFTEAEMEAHRQLVQDLGGPWPQMTRKMVDDAFLQAMEVIAGERSDAEPGRFTRAKLHRAVRAFGAGGWGR